MVGMAEREKGKEKKTSAAGVKAPRMEGWKEGNMDRKKEGIKIKDKEE